MDYFPDVFYDTSDLSKNQIRKLLKEAKDLSFGWSVDDQPTWTRRMIDWPFDKVIRLFDRTTRDRLHISVVHRRGYEDWKQYLSIGFCTLGRKHKNGDVFLWISVDIKHKDELLKKHLIWKTL